MRLMKLWEDYWFRPAPLFDLAVCRILVVGFQMYKLLGGDWREKFLVNCSHQSALYHPLPVLRWLTMPLGWAGPLSLFVGSWHYRPSFGLLELCYWVTVVAGLLVFIGLRTNFSLVIFAIGNIFMQAFLYSFGDFHHPEAIMMITLSIFALSPAGDALSVDALRHRLSLLARNQRFESMDVLQERSAFARWPLVLVRWVFALIYLSCAISKLTASGLDWTNGYTLQHALMEDGFRWVRPVGIWLGGQHFLVVILSWISIFFEGTFFIVLVFPWMAWLYIPLGVAFHTGIYVAMAAPFFQFVVVYSVFVPWAEAARRLVGWLHSVGRAKPVEIFYDGQCPLCLRSMTILQTFDWFQQLVFSDLETAWPRLAARHPEVSLEACRQDMHVLRSDGMLQKGFFAYREILKVLPPLWPLLVVFYAPLARGLVLSCISGLLHAERGISARPRHVRCSR